ERALALQASQRIPAVQTLAGRPGVGSNARAMAHTIIAGSTLGSLDTRKSLIDKPVADLHASTDPPVVFTRQLEPTLKDQRQRIRVLNEKLLQNRAAFASGLAAWKGSSMYPDANFTLRATYGKVAGYTDLRGAPVPFTTRFGDMFALAASRGNTGDFALPPKLTVWRQKIGDQAFKTKY